MLSPADHHHCILPPPFSQIRCFDAPLQPQALQDVKNIVERNIPSGVTEGGLTLEGKQRMFQLR